MGKDKKMHKETNDCKTWLSIVEYVEKGEEGDDFWRHQKRKERKRGVIVIVNDDTRGHNKAAAAKEIDGANFFSAKRKDVQFVVLSFLQRWKLKVAWRNSGKINSICDTFGKLQRRLGQLLTTTATEQKTVKVSRRNFVWSTFQFFSIELFFVCLNLCLYSLLKAKWQFAAADVVCAVDTVFCAVWPHTKRQDFTMW